VDCGTLKVSKKVAKQKQATATAAAAETKLSGLLQNAIAQSLLPFRSGRSHCLGSHNIAKNALSVPQHFRDVQSKRRAPLRRVAAAVRGTRVFPIEEFFFKGWFVSERKICPNNNSCLYKSKALAGTYSARLRTSALDTREG